MRPEGAPRSLRMTRPIRAAFFRTFTYPRPSDPAAPIRMVISSPQPPVSSIFLQ